MFSRSISYLVPGICQALPCDAHTTLTEYMLLVLLSYITTLINIVQNGSPLIVQKKQFFCHLHADHFCGTLFLLPRTAAWTTYAPSQSSHQRPQYSTFWKNSVVLDVELFISAADTLNYLKRFQDVTFLKANTFQAVFGQWVSLGQSYDTDLSIMGSHDGGAMNRKRKYCKCKQGHHSTTIKSDRHMRSIAAGVFSMFCWCQ